MKVAENKPSAGQVIIEVNGVSRPNRHQDTRHTLLVYLTFTYGLFHNAGSAWDLIVSEVQKLKVGTVITIGIITDTGRELDIIKGQRRPIQTRPGI